MIYVHRVGNVPRTFNKNVDHNDCDNMYKLAHQYRESLLTLHAHAQIRSRTQASHHEQRRYTQLKTINHMNFWLIRRPFSHYQAHNVYENVHTEYKLRLLTSRFGCQFILFIQFVECDYCPNELELSRQFYWKIEEFCSCCSVKKCAKIKIKIQILVFNAAAKTK